MSAASRATVMTEPTASRDEAAMEQSFTWMNVRLDPGQARESARLRLDRGSVQCTGVRGFPFSKKEYAKCPTGAIARLAGFAHGERHKIALRPQHP